MRTILLVLTICLTSICPEPAAAQLDARSVQYDWRSQSFLKLEKVSPGDLVRLQILNANAFCYDFVIAIEQVVFEETSIDVAALFTGALASAVVPPSGSMEEKNMQVMSDSLQKAISTFKVAGAQEAARRKAEDVKKIGDTIDSLRLELDNATVEASNISTLAKAAKKASDDFYAVACPTKGRGGNIAATNSLLMSAVDSINALLTALDGLPAISKKAKAITDELGLTSLKVEEFGREYPDDHGARSVLDLAISRLEIDAEKLTAAVSTLGKLSRQSLAAGAAQIKTAADADTITRTVPVGSNTATIRISITATGKRGISTVSKRKLDDAFEISVERKHRVFLSLGFIWSTLPSKHYERVNRIADDTTFSTYAAVESSSSTGFAPGILVNVSLWSVDDFSVYASGGVAARPVNNTLTPPDYFLGVSFGVIDRILLSLLAQRGRVEVLLLGDEETVMESAVPAAVARESAVGTTTEWAFALAFTVRI